MIKDRPHIEQHVKSPSIRELFARHRNVVERSKQISDKRHGSIIQDALPICTIIFELIDTSTDVISFADLVQLPGSIPNDTFRIAYNRTYPSTEISHSVRLFLGTDISFRGIIKSPPPGRICHRHPHLYSYDVRVLPICGKRPPFAKLSPNIILRIARYAVGHHGPSRWRSALLSLGLVSKSWSHVLDIFFRLHDSNCDKPTAMGVARSLELRPERGKLIQHFNTWNYHTDITEDNEKALQRCIALSMIARMAPSITLVCIPDMIHISAFQEFMFGLSELRQVEIFIMHGSSLEKQQAFAEDITRYIGIDDVQTCIAKWSNLRKVNIGYWTDGIKVA